jgi:hypothetical protein
MIIETMGNDHRTLTCIVGPMVSRMMMAMVLELKPTQWVSGDGHADGDWCLADRRDRARRGVVGLRR